MIIAPRYLPKVAATVGLFTRYGLKDFARQQGLLEIAPVDGVNGDGTADDGIGPRAKAFRERLIDLGPAYVKLGQVLSTRPDLIPEPYIEELQHLQDDVGAIPFADVEATIQEELGGRISKLFSSFDHTPLGTASLGQAHAAELRDGRSVVVKVQRPGIRPQLAEDLEFFRELARFLAHHTRAGARVDLLGIVQQLERALADELDYRVEARNAATLRRSLAEFAHLLIPRVIEAYTSQRVLTTERIRGIKVDEVHPIVRLEHDFSSLADEFAKGYLKQIVIDGHFHADPHPGNVFIVLPGRANPMTPAEVVATDRRREPRAATTPLTRIEEEAQDRARDVASEDEPRLALIDFGMTARVTPTMRDMIVRLLNDMAENRGDAAAETLIEIGEPIDGFDRAAFVRKTAALIAHNHDRTVGEIEAGKVLFELTGIAYEQGLRLPAELTLLAKTLFSIDAVTRALDPTYSPITAIRTYAGEVMADRAKREMSPRALFQAASNFSELMRALPHRVDLITQRMANNELGVRVDAPQLSVLLKGMQKIANRVFTGLLLTGLLIASAMLMPYRRQLGTVGFVIAALLGVWMVAAILISDRKRE